MRLSIFCLPFNLILPKLSRKYYMQTLIQIQHRETEKSLINYYDLYEKFSKKKP